MVENWLSFVPSWHRHSAAIAGGSAIFQAFTHNAQAVQSQTDNDVAIKR